MSLDRGDGDAVRAALRAIRTSAGVPVTFAGTAADGAGRRGGEVRSVQLGSGVGLRTSAMLGLTVTPGAGLGGRVMGTGRPAAVTDYGASDAITKEYLRYVSAEGLRSILAAPVLVDGRVRAVLYVADRNALTFGDPVRRAVQAAVRELTGELRIRDEVERRVGYAEAAAVAVGPGTAAGSAADRELLRELYSELRALAGGVEDAELRAGIEGACGRILAAGATRVPGGGGGEGPEVPARGVLAAREVDVLAQVALGCSNAEAARRLSLSPETVKAYLRNAAQKLGTSTRFESVTRARTLGLLP